MKFALFSFLLLALTCVAQTPQPISATEDISGMYTFLKDGEFVQLDIDGPRATGFISRFGETDSDKGAVLDHMFKEGELKGNDLHFVTKSVHGIWYEFAGSIQHGEEKDPNKEGYRVLKGKLTMYTGNDAEKTSGKSREVIFKSFPVNALASH
jgi:hypothetical protein